MHCSSNCVDASLKCAKMRLQQRLLGDHAGELTVTIRCSQTDQLDLRSLAQGRGKYGGGKGREEGKRGDGKADEMGRKERVVQC